MANVKQTDILTGSIPRQLLAFFLPIWFGTLFQQLYNTADTLIVGNFVGTRALAAVGATGAFVNLLVGLFVGLCSGVGVVVSQSFGARDYDGVDRQVHTALVLSVAIGALLTVLGVVLASLITGNPYLTAAGTGYVNLSMFFAFATLYPDAQVLLFFFIPVKIKWMAILDACYFAYIIFFCAASRYWIGVVLPLVALLNFFVFFAPEIGRFAKREQTRTKQAAHFHNAVRQTQREQQSQGYRHKCAVCGRTDVTNPELQFRYCSKCAGYHCFCSDHIFNHVHFTDENP